MATLRVLGGALLEGPCGPLDGPVAQRRQLALLSVLVVHRGTPVSRDRAVALLCPDSTTRAARRSLSDALHRIREALGPGTIRALGDALLLDPSALPSDLDAFECALARGALADAVHANPGPFLEGFHLPGSREFEHWMERERLRLEEAALGAMVSLAREAEDREDREASAHWWRRAALRDPLDSSIAAGAIRALRRSGHPAAARRLEADHLALLHEEFGAEAAQEGAEVLAVAVQAPRSPGRGGGTRPGAP